MAFDVLPVPVPGSPTFNVDAQLFATGMAAFAQEANAIGSVMDLSLKSTSSSSLSIGTGSKTLTVQIGLGYVIGHPVRIASISNPSNFMDGIVTAYNSVTGSLTVNVLSVGGSGTINSWNTMVLPGGGNFASLSNNKFAGRQIFADEVTIASAATLNLTGGNSNQFVVTGTTGITAVTMEQGAVYKARFTGACPLTHSANLQLPGSANYTTTPGDILTFISNGTSVYVEVSPKSGQPIFLKTASNDPSLSSNDGSPISSDWLRALLKFSSEYTSPQQSITSAGTLTLAHGLGKPVKFLDASLVCATSEFGWAVNDVVEMGWFAIGSGAAATAQGFVWWSDSTNLYILFGNASGSANFQVPNKTSGNLGNANNANWRIVFKAWG